MTDLRLLVLSTLLAVASPVLADSADAAATLTKDLKAHVPPQWLVRVRWRDGQLLASITPLPYDTAFQLWYQPEKLHETMAGLCPKVSADIWSMLRSDQDVILEPTVGGKSGPEVRVSCRMEAKS